MTRRLIFPLLGFISLVSVVLPFSGCSGQSETSIEVELDSAIQRWLRGNDARLEIKRKLVRLGEPDTFTHHYAIKYGLDSLNQFLEKKDSILEKAKSYEEDARIIQGFMPHDVDAQYMLILAGKMKWKVLDYERMRDSLLGVMQQTDSNEILVIRRDATYLEYQDDESKGAEIEYFVTTNSAGEVQFVGLKESVLIF